MSQRPRDTQRVPKSCTECTRRKIKCNKRIPCEPCSKRGDHLLCMREIVRVNGKIKIALDADPTPGDTNQAVAELRAENEKLRARLEQFEAIARERQLAGHELANLNASSSTAECSPAAVDDLVSAFESLHIPGHAYRVILDGPGSSHISAEQWMSLLPIRKSSELLICSSIENVGWIHCALNAPIFLAEHQSFWVNLATQTSNTLATPSWLALYFALIAVGGYFMADEDTEQIHFLHEGLSGLRGPGFLPQTGNMSSLSRIWYNASLQYLNASDFIGQPILMNIQAMSVLNLLHRNLGQTQRDYLLLGLAINSARVIGMDKLGCESDFSVVLVNSDTWSDRNTRELGRRLWWTLVICDWMRFSTRPISIDSRSFNTKLSRTLDQSHSQIILSTSTFNPSSDASIPSPLLFHVLAAKLAQVLYAYTNSHLEAHMTRVRKALRDIDILYQNLPPHLTFTSLQNCPTNLPTWITLQRLQALFLHQVNRIRLCFVALPHFLEHHNPEDEILKFGLAAANSILDTTTQQQIPHVFSKLWGTVPCISAAGVYLVLDLICFRDSKTEDEIREQRNRIQDLLLREEGEGRGNGKMLRKLWAIGESWPRERKVDKQSLFRIMKLDHTTSSSWPNTTGNPDEGTELFANAVTNNQTTPTSYSGTPSSMYSYQNLGNTHDNGLGQEYEGFPMNLNLDFMEFDGRMDSYQGPPLFDHELDMSSFLGISPGRGSY